MRWRARGALSHRWTARGPCRESAPLARLSPRASACLAESTGRLVAGPPRHRWRTLPAAPAPDGAQTGPSPLHQNLPIPVSHCATGPVSPRFVVPSGSRSASGSWALTFLLRRASLAPRRPRPRGLSYRSLAVDSRETPIWTASERPFLRERKQRPARRPILLREWPQLATRFARESGRRAFSVRTPETRPAEPPPPPRQFRTTLSDSSSAIQSRTEAQASSPRALSRARDRRSDCRQTAAPPP